MGEKAGSAGDLRVIKTTVGDGGVGVCVAKANRPILQVLKSIGANRCTERRSRWVSEWGRLRGLWAVDSRTTEIRLMFRSDWHLRRSWAAAVQGMHLLNILFEERIEAKVGAESGKIVGVGEPVIVSVLDHHVPAHESHLEAENRWVPPVVR
jgi:hypothetical protein